MGGNERRWGQNRESRGVQTIDRISCGSGDVSVWLLCPTRESDEGASFPKQGPTFNDVWQKTLEINPNHPVVVDLLAKIKADKSDKAAVDTAEVLFQTALIESGYELADASALVNRVYRLMSKELGVDPDARVKEVEVPEGEEEEAEEEEKDEKDDEESKDETEETRIDGEKKEEL